MEVAGSQYGGGVKISPTNNYLYPETQYLQQPTLDISDVFLT